jgi:hypothetical protein
LPALAACGPSGRVPALSAAEPDFVELRRQLAVEGIGGRRSAIGRFLVGCRLTL